MRNIAREREPAKAEPPMTPMIDIIFQLLIFFMLTPTFSGNEEYLTTNLPDTTGANPAKPREVEEVLVPIDVLEDSTGKLCIVRVGSREWVPNEDGQLVGRAGGMRLADYLRDFTEAGADQPVRIHARTGVFFRWVVAVQDACIAAKFSDIRFQVSPQGVSEG